MQSAEGAEMEMTVSEKDFWMERRIEIPVLEEKDIFLRWMDEGDTDDIIRWRNSKFVYRNFIYQSPFTRQGHEKWMREMIGTGKAVQFMIIRKDTGSPIGSVYLRDIDQTHHKAEYGVFIGEKDALGKGFGTQAAKLMIGYAFDTLGLHKLMLRVLADNLPAIKSYEKAGFIREAYLKDEVYLEETYKDVIYMAVINDEND